MKNLITTLILTIAMSFGVMAQNKEVILVHYKTKDNIKQEYKVSKDDFVKTGSSNKSDDFYFYFDSKSLTFVYNDLSYKINPSDLKFGDGSLQLYTDKYKFFINLTYVEVYTNYNKKLDRYMNVTSSVIREADRYYDYEATNKFNEIK